MHNIFFFLGGGGGCKKRELTEMIKVSCRVSFSFTVTDSFKKPFISFFPMILCSYWICIPRNYRSTVLITSFSSKLFNFIHTYYSSSYGYRHILVYQISYICCPGYTGTNCKTRKNSRHFWIKWFFTSRSIVIMFWFESLLPAICNPPCANGEHVLLWTNVLVPL